MVSAHKTNSYTQKKKFLSSKKHILKSVNIYRVTQKDGLNFVRLYFLNYTWYVNDLHNI